MGRTNGLTSLYAAVNELLTASEGQLDRLGALGHVPEPVLDNSHARICQMPRAGIELHFSKKRNCFTSAAFFIDTPATRSGSLQSCPTSCLDEIHRQIAQLRPVTSVTGDGQSVEFQLADRRISCFCNRDGERLQLVLVKLNLS
jgi:hypothetical protein